MKTLKIVGILVVLFILCSLVVTVQAGAKVSAPEVEWDKTFGGTDYDCANSVQQTSDGGYILAGKTDSYGAGSSDFWDFYDIWLVKTDSTGNKLWDKTFGGTGWDEAYSVQQTSDGGYILAGETSSYGAGSHDIWLVKTDSTGNKLWDKTFGGTDWDGAYSVQQTSDGGYILAGETYSYGAGSSDIWLVKTDSTGNKLWDKTFGGTDWDGAESVQQTSDGGYILAGETESYGADRLDFWLVKTDSTGNKLWDKTFGGTDWDGAESVQQTSDGGYILAGGTAPYGLGSYDILLVKTDSTGNKLWDKTFSGTGDDCAYSVQQTSDGGYILAGATESYGGGSDDIWLIKTDSSGNKLWDKTVGGVNLQWAESVQQTSDGGYIIAGNTESYGAGSTDFWLIKMKGEHGEEEYNPKTITTETPIEEKTTPTPPTTPEGKIKAIWLYNHDKYGTTTVLTDLKSAGINTVFLSIDVNNIQMKYERFIKSAHENGLEVHAMILEDPRCTLKENHESSIQAVESVLDYNNEQSLAKFDGINIDTEPYVDLDLEQVWQDYITLLEAVHEKTKGKTVLSADIPRWYDEAKIKDIAPNLDFFVIMAYDSGSAGWNTAQDIVEKVVPSEMEAISGEGSKAVIGIGVHEGFEDKGEVEKCVDELYSHYSGDSAFLGVSIFRYESYSGLTGAPHVTVPTGEEKEIPGFEAIFTIAGLLAVVYLLRRQNK